MSRSEEYQCTLCAGTSGQNRFVGRGSFITQMDLSMDTDGRSDNCLTIKITSAMAFAWRQVGGLMDSMVFLHPKGWDECIDWVH